MATLWSAAEAANTTPKPEGTPSYFWLGLGSLWHPNPFLAGAVLLAWAYLIWRGAGSAKEGMKRSARWTLSAA
jgi:hypothetical protein